MYERIEDQLQNAVCPESHSGDLGSYEYVIITIIHIKEIELINWNKVQLKKFLSVRFHSRFSHDTTLIYPITNLSTSLDLLLFTAARIRCLNWPPAQYTHTRHFWENSTRKVVRIVTYLYPRNQEIWTVTRHIFQSGAMTKHINTVTLYGSMHTCMYVCTNVLVSRTLSYPI
jgi:hypothetical protein